MMCLTVNETKTAKAKKRKGFVLRWKFLSKTSTGLVSPTYSHHWLPGWNRAKKTRGSDQSSTLTYSIAWNWGTGESLVISAPPRRVDGGAIHVWTARPYAEPRYVCVRVRCYAHDLVGVGNGGDEAYRKVFLPKAEYERATKHLR